MITLNEVVPYEGRFGTIRGITINEVPWFVGKDVCTCLGYTKPDKAYEHCKYLKILKPSDLEGLGITAPIDSMEQANNNDNNITIEV